MTSKTVGWSVFFKENPSVKSLSMIMAVLARERCMGLGLSVSIDSVITGPSVVGVMLALLLVVMVVTPVSGVWMRLSYWCTSLYSWS